jgi:vacuolar-type H+-ATPase subunit E/Vma4
LVNADEISTATSDEHAETKNVDALGALRGQVEAVLEALSQTAARIEATARAEAEEVFRARTREATEKLDEAQREADELLARAHQHLAVVERLENAFSERFELVQGRLVEVANEFSALATVIRGLRELVSEEAASSKATVEPHEEAALDESLRQLTHSIPNAEGSQPPR